MKTINTPAQADPTAQQTDTDRGDEMPSTAVPTEPAREVGGRGGLDPTRYGDWEKNGRCIDF